MLRLPDDYLQRLLDEDVPSGDLTTHLLRLGDVPARMSFTARISQTVCCIEEAARLVEMAGGRAAPSCRTGQRLDAKSPMLEAEGPAEALLAAWKVAQNLVEAASGIATAVARLADAAQRGGGAVVACTRKTFPGARRLSLRAVFAGGGTAHRLGLSDSLLVFPEHRALLDGDLAGHIARLKAVCPERKVVAEVLTVAEAKRLAEAGADVIQLEKFPVEDVAEVARALKGHPGAPIIAAAGGIVADNAEAYVRAGARVLVTSSPYWAKPSEVAVSITRA